MKTRDEIDKEFEEKFCCKHAKAFINQIHTPDDLREYIHSLLAEQRKEFIKDLGKLKVEAYSCGDRSHNNQIYSLIQKWEFHI